MKTYEQMLEKYKSYNYNLPYISPNAIEKLEDKGYIVEIERSGRKALSIEEMLKNMYEYYDIKSIRFAETNGTPIKGLRYTVIIARGEEKKFEGE